MRSVVRWAIHNTPAMNTLMISVLVVGAVSLMNLRREVFPEFDLEMITVTVPYPGGSPEEVEDGICRKIEEAVRSVDGIKKQTAVARENSGSVVLELEEGARAQKILGEVRSEVDRISTFPVLAEDPEVKQLTVRRPAIQVGLVGPETERSGGEVELRNLAEAVRDDLIRLPAVSQAEIVGAKDYQIDIEMSEATLRRYGLTLREVARIVRRRNFDLPGGLMRTEGQDVLIRGKSKRLTGREIAKIPLVTQAEGVVLTVGDLGTVRDEFADVTSFTRIDGKPGLAISVNRTATEDLLAMADAVNGYVERKELPAGHELVTWQDDSINVRDRMELLGKNGLMGLALVLLTLSVFLELRLAWWVALGIPISLLGACAVLFFSGQTLNMLSMFAFLMALGIVVDDAIVIGENIYTHRQRGVGFVRAAVDGTLEVLPSVAASVTTTIFAFLPLFFVTGVMGKFIAVMPLAMIAMLALSLVEGIFILPCHLAHGDGDRAEGLIARTRRVRRTMPSLLRWTGGSLALGAAFLLAHFFYPLRKVAGLLGWINVHALRLLNSMTRRIYLPLLRTSLRNPAIAVSSAVTLLLLAVALVRGGLVPFVLFPKLDSNTIDASVAYPDGTPAEVTDRATRRLEAAIRRVNARYEQQGTPVLRLTRRSVGYTSQRQGAGMTTELSGGHFGGVTAELVDVADRPVNSQTLVRQWRNEAGELPGVESLTFGAAAAGPGGTPIEFKFLAKEDHADILEQAVAQAKAKLLEYPGVFDVRDDSRPGKWELQLRVKEDAEAMGVSEAEVAETVRAAYYGEEVMRLQRGRHEVKLMVRYPRKDRRSLAAFEDIRIRADDGAERPVTELAEVHTEQSLSEINRVDQLRAITVSADVDENRANAREIVSELQ
ncbi:MAG: efflux RND transporter permease subunit, partial [Planctomycetota bacterium]